MKFIFKRIMGIAVFIAACSAVTSYLKTIATEQKYVVLNENREEII